MSELSERKQKILYYIICIYTDTMQPVGSRALCRHYDLSLSAATVRNEMCDLEEMGFITHPHTSAGRIPTDKGYRFFVDHMLQEKKIPQDTLKRIQDLYRKRIDTIEDLIQTTTEIISTISHETCLAVLFRPELLFFKQVSLVLLDPKRLLVIWVTTSGNVSNHIMTLKEELTQEYIKRIENYLNSELCGMQLQDIEGHVLQQLTNERDSLYKIYTWARHITQASIGKNIGSEKVFLNGRNFLLEKPEFMDIAKTKRLFDLFENKKALIDVVRPLEQNGGSVIIRIGKENSSDDLWDCSLVSAQYHYRNVDMGTINILGPRRLHYGQAVRLLKHISHMMTETLNQFEIM